MVANRVYSSDHGTGFERGTGDESTGEGWKYRGNGQLQLTGKTVIERFAQYCRTNFAKVGQTAAQAAQLYQTIMSTPDILDTDIALSAQSAAWLWQQDLGLNIRADALDETDASPPVFTYSEPGHKIRGYVPGNPYTDKITRKIAGDVPSFDNRWKSWRNNITLERTGGNPYESVQDVLDRVGIHTVNAKGYKSQIGLQLQVRKPLEIASSVVALIADVGSEVVATSEHVALTS